MWMVLMRGSVRGGAIKASSVQVVVGKDWIPLMVRDEEPFFAKRWSDVESGNEYIDEYRLVFDFREGLLVEITQRLDGESGFSWEVPLDRLNEETLMRLKNSQRLELIRAKVREIIQLLTENLDALFFDLKAGD
jgi:hypothetical protein